MSTALTSDQRVALLREQLSDPAGPRSDARSARLPRRDPAANVLIGVVLHAAARRGQGLELTGLEQRLTDQFAGLFGEDVLAAFGRVHLEPASRSAAASLFPAMITERSLTEGVSMWDMQDFLPTIEAEIAGLPGVRTVTAEELAAGALTGEEDVVLVTGAPVEDTEYEVEPGSEARVRFVRFGGDRGRIGSGSGEIHWTSAAADDSGVQMSMVTATHTGVDAGTVRDLGPGTYWYKGAARRFVVGDIRLREGDNGDSADVRPVLAYIARSFAVYGREYGPTWDPAVHRAHVVVTAALVDWILSLYGGDVVARKTIAFGPDALARLACIDNGFFDLSVLDGDTGGGHTLTLEVSFDRAVAVELKHSTFYDDAWSRPVRVPYLYARTRPSLVAHGGDLWVAYIDASAYVMLARYDGESWGFPIRAAFPNTGHVSAASGVGVTLLSHAGDLYVYWANTDDGRRHLSTIDTANGLLTTVTTQQGHEYTAPALLSHGGRIHLITTWDGVTVGVLEAGGWREVGSVDAGEEPSDALPPAAVSYRGRAWVHYVSEGRNSCEVVSSTDPGGPVSGWRHEPGHVNATAPDYAPAATVAVVGPYNDPGERMACTVAAARGGTPPFNTHFLDVGGTVRTVITDWNDLRQGQSVAVHQGITHTVHL